MKRREFVMIGAAGAVLTGMPKAIAAKPADGGSGVEKPPAPPRNRRPYKGLDWSKVIRVKTT